LGSQTLAVIGATFGDGRIGFYLLANDPVTQQIHGFSYMSGIIDPNTRVSVLGGAFDTFSDPQ
jgi:hypothetical protein